jgi:hypothetical protein
VGELVHVDDRPESRRRGERGEVSRGGRRQRSQTKLIKFLLPDHASPHRY